MSEKPDRIKFQQIFHRFNTLRWRGIDFLFPPVCAGCGTTGSRFCVVCIQDTPKLNKKNCALCGVRLPQEARQHICPRTGSLDRVLVWGMHSGPLREALHHFKYRRDLGLAESFSDLLTDLCLLAGVQAHVAVPIPLAKKRLAERGYNQSALLAEGVAARLQIPCLPQAATRIRETRSQVGLSIAEREHNMSGAFRADGDLVSGRRVLLIDDVLTTGATLNACADALKQVGAVWITGVTLARAP